jgi:hypothetical protein
VLFLPFQFSVNLSRRVTRRNLLPYLRHSWTRTDAVSIVAFWITFVLAQTCVEHSAARHVSGFKRFEDCFQVTVNHVWYDGG